MKITTSSCTCHEVHTSKNCFGQPLKQEEIHTIELEQDGSEFHCRFHPINWMHEYGCEHYKWTNEQLRETVIFHKKQFYAKMRECERYRWALMHIESGLPSDIASKRAAEALHKYEKDI